MIIEVSDKLITGFGGLFLLCVVILGVLQIFELALKIRLFYLEKEAGRYE